MRRRATTRATALRAALLSLAVVAGVLAMHAVGGGAHGAGSTGHPAAAAAGVTGHAVSHGMPGTAPTVAVVPNIAERVPAGLAAQEPGAPEQLAVPAAMCVAMLLSVLALIRRAAGHVSLVRRSKLAERGPVQRSVRWPMFRPPDLLTELCVMRT